MGILIRLSGLVPSAFAEGNRLFTEFKGALSENYILQALIPQLDAVPRYWSKYNPNYEVDNMKLFDNKRTEKTAD